jgi:hypothetical protein
MLKTSREINFARMENWIRNMKASDNAKLLLFSVLPFLVSLQALGYF